MSKTDSPKALASTASGRLDKASGGSSGAAPVRTVAEIEADLNATRDRLAGTVANLEQRLNPRTLMDRAISDAKGRVTAFYLDEQGKLRPERVALTAGAVVVGLVGLRLTVKGLNWLTAPPQPKLPDTDIVYIPVSREQLLATNPTLTKVA